MNLSVTLLASLERRSLLQKMRLKSATERHSARIALTLSGEDFALLPRIPRKTLEAWAGRRLAPLVDELSRCGRADAGRTEVAISRPIAGPEDGSFLRRRAGIFADLVRFAIAEQRLIAACESAAQPEQQ